MSGGDHRAKNGSHLLVELYWSGLAGRDAEASCRGEKPYTRLLRRRRYSTCSLCARVHVLSSGDWLCFKSDVSMSNQSSRTCEAGLARYRVRDMTGSRHRVPSSPSKLPSLSSGPH